MRQKLKSDFGGAAIEYLVVSLVTIGISFAAIKIVKQSIREKLEQLDHDQIGISEKLEGVLGSED